jgi:hypothetical protein
VHLHFPSISWGKRRCTYEVSPLKTGTGISSVRYRIDTTFLRQISEYYHLSLSIAFSSRTVSRQILIVFSCVFPVMTSPKAFNLLPPEWRDTWPSSLVQVTSSRLRAQAARSFDQLLNCVTRPLHFLEISQMQPDSGNPPRIVEKNSELVDGSLCAKRLVAAASWI